jgi:hypothetical protein
MNDKPNNGDEKMGAFVGRLIWRFGLSILVGVGTYAALWVKANVPSREQFETLQQSTVSKLQFETLSLQVQTVRDEVLRWPNYRDTVKDFEARLRELERKFPPPDMRPKPLK